MDSGADRMVKHESTTAPRAGRTKQRGKKMKRGTVRMRATATVKKPAPVKYGVIRDAEWLKDAVLRKLVMTEASNRDKAEALRGLIAMLE